MAFPHESLVDLFRESPELAREVLQRCAGIAVAGRTAELGSIDLTQVASAEFRADAVSVFRDAGVARAAVIVEVQLHDVHDKRYTWPVYVAALRARLRCPVTLLVIAPEEGLARRAGAPIELGHPGFRLTPIVMAYRDAPRIADPEEARALPQLTLLSGLAHPEDGELLAPAVAVALGVVSADTRKLYFNLIKAKWSEAATRNLEECMTPEVKAKVEEWLYERGMERGLEAGRGAALALARSKLAGLTPADELAIRGIADPAALTALVVALGHATTDAEARAILDSVSPQ